jgi:hypothetical protein
MELVLDYVEKEDTTIAMALIFILKFVGVVFLIEAVLWRVGIILSSDPRQIFLITSIDIDASINSSFDIVDIGINVRWLSVGVGLLLAVLCIEATFGV